MRRRSEPLSENLHSVRSPRALLLPPPSPLLRSRARFAERPAPVHHDPSEAGRCLTLRHVFFKKRAEVCALVRAPCAPCAETLGRVTVPTRDGNFQEDFALTRLRTSLRRLRLRLESFMASAHANA